MVLAKVKAASYQNTNRGSRDSLHGANINSLTAKLSVTWSSIKSHYKNSPVITQPISKIHPLNHHSRPLMALQKRHRLEHILDIAMTPILTFDRRYPRNISRSERERRRWTEHQHKAEDEKHASTWWQRHRHSCNEGQWEGWRVLAAGRGKWRVAFLAGGRWCSIAGELFADRAMRRESQNARRWRGVGYVQTRNGGLDGWWGKYLAGER